jgi:hypothetical protein
MRSLKSRVFAWVMHIACTEFLGLERSYHVPKSKSNRSKMLSLKYVLLIFGTNNKAGYFLKKNTLGSEPQSLCQAQWDSLCRQMFRICCQPIPHFTVHCTSLPCDVADHPEFAQLRRRSRRRLRPKDRCRAKPSSHLRTSESRNEFRT